MRTLGVTLVCLAVILAGFALPGQANSELNARLTLKPSTSIAPKGALITVTAVFKNEDETETDEGTLIIDAGEEFEVKSANPPATISGKRVTFRLPKLQNGQNFRATVHLLIVTQVPKAGLPMTVKAHAQTPSGKITTRCVILLWAPNEYPALEAELVEVAREKGKITFNLKIQGGFPPYEFYFNWGDQANPGFGDVKGGLSQEGTHVIEHTYLRPGEYFMNGFINDWLGKQVVLRRRLYIISWEDKP